MSNSVGLYAGKNITHVGGNADGQTTKVPKEIIVALNIAAVSEALVFASKAGADPAKVRQALMSGFAASRILEVHGERMVKHNFNPGFRIGPHQKDRNLDVYKRQRQVHDLQQAGIQRDTFARLHQALRHQAADR